MSEYEEVFQYDDDGNEVGSYVERVITGPEPDEPPDDYYDQDVTVLPVGVYDSRTEMIAVGDSGVEISPTMARFMDQTFYSTEPPF